MTPGVTFNQGVILKTYLSETDWTNGVLAQIELETRCKELLSRYAETRRFPLLLFDQGINTTPFFYSGMAQKIASRGYEDIAMDHPYESNIVEFPDATVIYCGRSYPPGNVTYIVKFTPYALYALSARVQDAFFVLDSLVIEEGSASVGFLGHSFVGAAAAAALLNDSRIAAAINMDGTMYGPVIKISVSKPFLMFSSAGHNTSTDPTWGNFTEAMAANHPESWFKKPRIVNSTHLLVVTSRLLGTSPDWGGIRTWKRFFFGMVTGKGAAEILAAHVDDFFKITLAGKEEGLLSGPNSAYSEVQFCPGTIRCAGTPAGTGEL